MERFVVFVVTQDSFLIGCTQIVKVDWVNQNFGGWLGEPDSYFSVQMTHP